MLAFSEPSVYQTSKCYVTYGTMGHLDPKQLPTKGKPWSTIAGLDFIHKVDLLIPQELLETVLASDLANRPAPEFRRVIMSLGEILSGDFLKEYIKQGNVMMLSEGIIGVDNVFVLKNGQLKMFLDKETYERAGLVGKPYGVKGKRGLKPKWVVETDLTSPAMFPGKKGFDRLIYACKNVLNRRLTWLFYNTAAKTPNPDPMTPQAPTNLQAQPIINRDITVAVPPLKPEIDVASPMQREDYEDYATEIYEWLSLARLESPRILSGDQIDPYLSRYQVPGNNIEQLPPSKICKITWEGLLASDWARQTLIDVMLALPSKAWFSLSATTFSTGLVAEDTDCTFLRMPNSPGEYFMWEVKGHE